MSIGDGNKNKLVVDMTGLNFDEIKENIINAAKAKSTFTDYDFQGSGLNAIIDTLAYATQYSATMANFLGNEMYLDSAILRSSVVSRAKELGYTPISKTAARATVKITVNGVQNNPSALLLPAGTIFTSQNDYGSYTFVTINDYNLTQNPENPETYECDDVQLVQGVYKTWYFSVKDTLTDRYIIPSSNIDTTTLLVKILPNSNSQTFYVYNLSSSVLDINESSNVFFLKEVTNSYYEIYFGDGVLGKAPKSGNVIKCDYLETDGLYGNGCKSFAISASIDGYNDIDIVTKTSSFGGGEKESIESIKINAPLYFNAKDRAIVPNDYIVMLKREFPNISDFNAWGGEDQTPPEYGYVMISAISTDNYGTGRNLSETEIQSILAANVFKKNIFVIRPRFVKSEYTYLGITIKVYLNLVNSVLSKSDIRSEINAFCNLYNLELNKYNSSFVYSDFITQINNIDSSIVSVIVDVDLSKEFEMLPTGVNIDFDAAIEPGTLSLNQSFTINPDTLDNMSDGKLLNTALNYNIYDDLNGNINLLTIDINNGVKVKTNTTIGTVNYTTGLVKLNFVSMTNTKNKISCTARDKDIHGQKNKILSFDMPKIKIDLIAKSSSAYNEL